MRLSPFNIKIVNMSFIYLVEFFIEDAFLIMNSDYIHQANCNILSPIYCTSFVIIIFLYACINYHLRNN